SKFGRNRVKTRGDRIESLVPGSLLESRWAGILRALSLHSAHRIQQPVGRVDAVKVLRNFRAQRPAGDRMTRVSLDLRCSSAQLIESDEHPAGMRTIVRTRSMDDFCHI